MQQKPLVRDKLNIVGERHDESDPRRTEEAAYTKKFLGAESEYFRETGFKQNRWLGNPTWGDPAILRAESLIARLTHQVFPVLIRCIEAVSEQEVLQIEGNLMTAGEAWVGFRKAASNLIKEVQDEFARALQGEEEGKVTKDALRWMDVGLAYFRDGIQNTQWSERVKWKTDLFSIGTSFNRYFGDSSKVVRTKDQVDLDRSKAMHSLAFENAESFRGDRVVGVWKVGEAHIQEIKNILGPNPTAYNLMTREEFNEDFYLEYPSLRPVDTSKDRDRCVFDGY